MGRHDDDSLVGSTRFLRNVREFPFNTSFKNKSGNQDPWLLCMNAIQCSSDKLSLMDTPLVAIFGQTLLSYAKIQVPKWILFKILRASLARSLYSLPAARLQGALWMGGRKRREGGPALRPASAPGTSKKQQENSYTSFAPPPPPPASTVAGGQILTSNSKKVPRAGVSLTGPAP